MSFLDELTWRGLLHQTTSPELAAHLASGVRAGYAGFDPTSDSLTIGNFMGIKLLAHLQRAGHRPIVVSGGGTGLIGDPSGKSAERTLLTRELVEHNARSQQRIFGRFLDFSGPRAAKIVNNVDWLSSMSYLDMLRDIGKHFSVNQMIARDSVASRLEGREQGISYTEFSYMILQAYDFLHLYRAERCSIQLGGSDQFGNIVSGIDLIRRLEQGESFGATCPLVTTSDGQKIGKTEKGAIWLTADRTSPYRFYQYWLNTTDADAVKFLRWFTFLEQEAIQSLAQSLASEPGKREAQKALAAEMTRMTHGATELARAIATSEAIFSGDVKALDGAQIAEIAADLPSNEIAAAALSAGIPIVDLLTGTTCAASKREAREFVQNGAVSVNGEKVGAEFVVRSEHVLPAEQFGGVILLRRGKKAYHAVRVMQ
ncbi:MAG: tyrosine--tRNA ligase [Planctomycetaceae bacterium]|nr:tyrosine--tRNA ligase [Planctomycetaceae bacterium]